MTALVPFSYGNQPVRVVTIDGEPWFVLADLCHVLGHTNPSVVRDRLDDALSQTYPIPDALGRTQNATIVSEPGMYEVVIRSDKPEAVAFRRWITGEVLPSIRKTGTYSATPAIEEHKRQAEVRLAHSQMELCQSAKGLIHPDHLEAKARIILARGMGEAPELDPATRPLYAQDFLKGKNLTQQKAKGLASVFGKRLKKAYEELHGRFPQTYPQTFSNGQTRNVNAYTEADRPLMEGVWQQLAAEKGLRTDNVVELGWLNEEV